MEHPVCTTTRQCPVTLVLCRCFCMFYFESVFFIIFFFIEFFEPWIICLSIAILSHSLPLEDVRSLEMAFVTKRYYRNRCSDRSGVSVTFPLSDFFFQKIMTDQSTDQETEQVLQ